MNQSEIGYIVVKIKIFPVTGSRKWREITKLEHIETKLINYYNIHQKYYKSIDIYYVLYIYLSFIKIILSKCIFCITNYYNFIIRIY